MWLPQSNDVAFDLGRTMMRMSLRNYLAVVPAVPSDSESCFQAIDEMIDRYSIHPRRVYLVGVEAGGENAFYQLGVSKPKIICWCCFGKWSISFQ